ncbi:hypothetical protein [Mycolicibacterium hippocampi]|uniref:Uncharacterized protein n=1 Tax=Mycolicibacterium hippocampi TaxID=659824 RepID=A0A7I9ZIW7_9MYCO|nr:hypothetical protein [Mycolicibacterium hippocampi]GFH00972.1 hypothetical protein MHIP_14550 [Mycolicibacterium hippocampi]
MTTSTKTAPSGVDNFDWLDAIGAHPEATPADVLAALHIVGAPTDITTEQLDTATFRLQLRGFLRPVAIDGRMWTYELHIPEVPE